MNTNTKVLLSSIVVGIAQVGYSLLQPQPADGFAGIAQAVGILFSIGIISVIFGIFGFILSKEKRFAHAGAWFGISLAVIVALNLAAAPLRRAQWSETHPQIQNYDKNAPNYVGN